jgi:hypothetical protein
VGLGPTTVVRLERALAHEGLPLGQRCGRRCCTPPGGGPRRPVRTGRTPDPEAGLCGPTAPLGRATGTWSLPRPAGTVHRRTQHSGGQAAAGGRDGDPTSPTPQVRRRGTARARRRAGGARQIGSSTRRSRPRRRCLPVDGAVSVAVAPRRTPGNRRAGRPRRSTDRRAAPPPARTHR